MDCAALGGEKKTCRNFGLCCLVVPSHRSILLAPRLRGPGRCWYRGSAGTHTWAAAGAVRDQSWHRTPHKTHIWKESRPEPEGRRPARDAFGPLSDSARLWKRGREAPRGRGAGAEGRACAKGQAKGWHRGGSRRQPVPPGQRSRICSREALGLLLRT